MSDFNERLGETIREVRKMLSVSTKDLAKTTGIHFNTMSNIERARVDCPVGKLDKISRALGLEPHLMLELSGLECDDPRRDRILDLAIRNFDRGNE